MVISTSKFFTKVDFEKFTSASLNQIAWETMLLLINNVHEKDITVSQTRRNLTVRVICNLNSCNNFALVLLKKMHTFQPIWCAQFFLVYYLSVTHRMSCPRQKKNPCDTMCRAFENSNNFGTFNNFLFALLLSFPVYYRRAALLSGSC